MSKLVTIYGGSGFVGRYIAQRMARAGWRVRVAVRRPNEANFVKPYGVVGQVEPVLCNIRDDTSVAQVMSGADAVVNCVGILAEVGKNSFGSVQSDGAARIARIASEQTIQKMVHISAIGADESSESEYSKTKASGEAAVMEHMPTAVVLRPSVIFGPEDQFFNRFASMAKFGPFLPVVGAETRFQPVYVDDVAQAVENVLTTDAEPGVYELGGPDIATFRDLMQTMLETIHRHRIIVNIPFFVARIMASTLDLVQNVSFGLIRNGVVTRDQLHNLKRDNVVGANTRGLEELGILPTAMQAVLPEYLWSFRPSGQYDAIKESAKNLKT